MSDAKCLFCQRRPARGTDGFCSWSCEWAATSALPDDAYFCFDCVDFVSFAAAEMHEDLYPDHQIR